MKKDCRGMAFNHYLNIYRTSLVIQWVRLCAPNTGDPGSIPGRGTRARMPQLRVCLLQLRPGATKINK